MVEQVWSTPEIYRISVVLPENPLRNLNSYVILTPERSLVIDTGFNRPECRAALWAGVEELDLDLSKAALFLTHLHSDHTGLVWDFVEKGIPVYIGALDHAVYTALARPDGYAVIDGRFAAEGYPTAELERQYETNQARLYSPHGVYPAHLLQDGDALALGGVKAVAYHVPGHTPGHMVLYLPEEQLLFTGDHILFGITPNIGVWEAATRSLGDYLDSLEKMLRLPIQRAFPGHRAGGEDAHRRVHEIIEHHHQRLDEILAAISARPGMQAFEIAASITWNTRGLVWEQFPPHQRWFAMSETLSHLDYLLEQGRVTRRNHGERIIYETCAAARF